MENIKSIRGRVFRTFLKNTVDKGTVRGLDNELVGSDVLVFTIHFIRNLTLKTLTREAGKGGKWLSCPVRRGYKKKMNLLKISRFPDFVQYFPDFSLARFASANIAEV